MKNYHVVISANEWLIDQVFVDFTKYDVSFSDLKTAILKRVGNICSVNRVNKNKVKAKQIIKNAKSIDEMTYQINTQTDFHIVVEEATGWQQ
ncbi:TPA: hypothetical protein ACV42B_001877 [Listeria monocytogenes]|uniref:Gp41 protein n=2 Tax=root TaxID=1 RepID=Q8W5W6_9CAUD|nr:MULTISPECIES: hypothetical protein [Listeria]NP_511024.1 Gp41 protein [Listeria phage PSA]MCZ19003.1 hypothetical protein [Listeria monocytogenes serotype 4b]APH79213.1 uncharacterized protein LMKH_1254 [Listeria monocytogenes]AQY44493.1 hypothetical protein DC57_09405 [Listeria monocytogenes]EAA0123968.1 hypothetical protein [Listeria monocytogenes]EAA0187865.1 hypothetical protein [Listeria monocytogenes]